MRTSLTRAKTQFIDFMDPLDEEFQKNTLDGFEL